MARVLYGPGGSIISGRINGVTFQKGKYGYVANTTNWGVNRKYVAQNEVRSAFRSVTSLWRTLPPEEQKTWAISATDLGGAYQAFVKYNIPYWIKHHEIVRRNPTLATGIIINEIRFEFLLTQADQPKGFLFRITANVNWEAAGIKPSILWATAPNYGLQPSKDSAVPFVPTSLDYTGTVALISTGLDDMPSLITPVPSINSALWVTPVYGNNGAPAGIEVPYSFSPPDYITLVGGHMRAEASGINGVIHATIYFQVPDAGSMSTIELGIQTQVGLSPNDQYQAHPEGQFVSHIVPIAAGRIRYNFEPTVQYGPNPGTSGNPIFMTVVAYIKPNQLPATHVIVLQTTMM